MTDPNDESKSLPIAEARAAVLASGELEGLQGPEYRSGSEPRTLNEYSAWDSVFLATEARLHPDFARVIVTRRGQKPREVVISWEEYAEIIEGDPERVDREREWAATRERKPMSIFGAEVERHAYRVVFADILEPLIAAKRAAGAGQGGAIVANVFVQRDEAADARDFLAEVAAAQTPQDLDRLHDEAREAGVLKLNATLLAAFTHRIAQLNAKAPAAAPATPADIVLPAPPSTPGPSPLAVAARTKPLTAAKPARNRKRHRPPSHAALGVVPERPAA